MPVDLKKIEASLSSMSVAKRQELYRNACRLKTREARAVERMIADSGLPYIVGCITKDDPEWDMLEKIVKSAEVREAAVAAVSAGFPALAGADPILQRKMGGRYGLHNMTVQTAGDFVANLMRSTLVQKSACERISPLLPGFRRRGRRPACRGRS